MKCEESVLFIEEYIDGELDSRSAREVARHIDSCASCHRTYEAMKREQQIYSSYRRDIDVTPALWAGIQSRMTEEKAARSESGMSRLYHRLARAFGAPRLSPLWVAALLLLAVGLTIVAMEYIRRTERPPVQLAGGAPAVNQNAQPGNSPGKVNPTELVPGATGEPAPERPHEVQRSEIARDVKRPARSRAAARETRWVAARGTPSPEEVVREAEEKQLAAIAVLSKEIDKRRSEIDPGIVARFQVALTAVDRTIAETRQAVREHPGDPVAAQYMLAAYAEKIEVLKEIANQ